MRVQKEIAGTVWNTDRPSPANRELEEREIFRTNFSKKRGRLWTAIL